MVHKCFCEVGVGQVFWWQGNCSASKWHEETCESHHTCCNDTTFFTLQNIKQAEELIEKDDEKRKELGIPVPDAKALAEKKEKEQKAKEEEEKKNAAPVRPGALKRKLSEAR